jgi:lantibiotic leader peptide-processing serine protease
MIVVAVVAGAAALPPGGSPAVAAPGQRAGRFLVVARSAADYGALRAGTVRQGARVVRELPQLNTLVVAGSAGVRASLAADRRTLGVASDRLERIADPERPAAKLATPGLRGASRVPGLRVAGRAGGATVAAGRPGVKADLAISPDPGFWFTGLQWDFGRIGLPQGWEATAGDPAVSVGVADTGLDFTHLELANKVTQVIDLTQTENPPICKTYFGLSDDDLAAEFGGPATTDWNGHGSWIGGNIAAEANGTGINGIAPKVGLVSLKISQWCGSAYDSTILDALVVAANAGIDVVSISFGGYLDRADPDQDLIYRDYVAAVRYARRHGTAIVAAAGNEATRIGAGGEVLAHGTLTRPGSSLDDELGHFEVPGGVPGVVDVAATGNLVNRASAACAPGTAGDPADPNSPVCKPAGDPHQASGQGRRNQLAYYSNYGPRIDIAAPGGARKFNLPFWDRGGTPGFPSSGADLTNVWEDFSITSNWAVEIPCFAFAPGSGFPPDQCYTAIQGTSMATPHVSAALALEASAHPELRHSPGALVARLQAHANRDLHNLTTTIAAADTSPGDFGGDACPTGYCHLGGARIPDREAYGAGLVDVASP